jgi:hypothetical protein
VLKLAPVFSGIAALMISVTVEMRGTNRDHERAGRLVPLDWDESVTGEQE